MPEMTRTIQRPSHQARKKALASNIPKGTHGDTATKYMY